MLALRKCLTATAKFADVSCAQNLSQLLSVSIQLKCFSVLLASAVG